MLSTFKPSAADHSQVKHKECIGYTSNDIEIFITAYEITASSVKQTRAYRAHPLLLGKIYLALKWTVG